VNRELLRLLARLLATPEVFTTRDLLRAYFGVSGLGDVQAAEAVIDEVIRKDAFVMRVELGNEAMRNCEQVKELLREVECLLDNGVAGKRLKDRNGNEVGEFSCYAPAEREDESA
jgi:hypothetical protein